MSAIQNTCSQIRTDDNVHNNSFDDKMFDQFESDQIFPDNHGTELVSFSNESIGLALNDSLFNVTKPRPLALYIYDAKSPATYLFNALVLSSESIGTYLDENFLLWKWNRTAENYFDLLTTLIMHVGEEVATVIDSLPIDHYPLLICLVFIRGQIKVECVIQNLYTEIEVMPLLIQTRDVFVDNFELPDTHGLNLRNISNENWSITDSTITQVPKESAEFARVAADFDGGALSIVHIDRIENTVWLMQYLNQKSIVDARLEHHDTEKLLFHGCPYEAAQQILSQAFDHNRIGRNGASYGHGFYFSSSRAVSDRYALPNPLTGEKIILMCRVLVGKNCQGNSTMKTCPARYDSTSNGSDIYVVYTNKHILPEYLITYK